MECFLHFRPRIDERIKSYYGNALISTYDPLSHGVYTNGKRKKVLLLGSGGLSIGQAGEFDYSGSQVRAGFEKCTSS